jgi:ceramide glucosyltransferase
VLVIDVVFSTAVILAALYWIVAVACVARFGRRSAAPVRRPTPVTILKPLCGDDGQLYENLATLCRQDYATFEILCGVRDGGDPAIDVVQRLMHEFPGVELKLVVDDRVIGTNLKVSNLANLLRHAKHETLIIADADIRVGRDYLAAVTGALDAPAVGLATCLYRGVGKTDLASRLAAMFVNEWFLPAAVVGAWLETLRHAFGATIAVRRDTLETIGGFEAIAHHLADDYTLGRLVAARGLRIVLVPYLVDTVLSDTGLRALAWHELRWARTFRTLRPLSYFCSLVTFGIPLSLGWLVVGGDGRLAGAALLGHIALRCGIRHVIARIVGTRIRRRDGWLVPIRDVLSFAIGLTSFLGRRVRWNETDLYLHSDGRVEPRRRAAATVATPLGVPGEGRS